MNKYYWIFINIKSQIRSKKILQSRADKMVSSIPNGELKDWWAWCPLFRDWIPLKNIVKEKSGSQKLLIKLKEIVSLDQSMTENTLTGFNQDHPSMSPQDNNLKKSIIDSDLAEDEMMDVGAVKLNDYVGDELTLSDIPLPPALDGFMNESYQQGKVLKNGKKIHPSTSDQNGKNSAEKKANTEDDHRKDKSKDNDKDKNSDDRRSAPRYDVRFEVLILVQGRSFRTHTINLSESGANLEKPLPEDFADIPLEVVFMLNTSNLMEKFAVRGKVLSNRENLRFLTFNISNAENKKGFDRLMMLYFQGK